MTESIPGVPTHHLLKSQCGRTMEVTLLLGLAAHLGFLYLTPPLEIPAFELPPAIEPLPLLPEPEPEIQISGAPEEVVAPEPPVDLSLELEWVPEVTPPPVPLPRPPETSLREPVSEAMSPTGSIFSVEQDPQLLVRVDPVYPEMAREFGAEGTVVIEVVVGRSGRVAEARVVASDTIELLEQAALEAVRQYFFLPAKRRDVPVPTRVRIPIEFKLE